MPTEAEIKAHVRDPARVRAALSARATEARATYADTYFDRPDGSLAAADQELRVREVRTDGGGTVLWTFKGGIVDDRSGSKSEFETEVADAAAARDILTGLGFVVEFVVEKRCANYRFEAGGLDMLATVVEVPELAGDTFIEVETIVDDGGDVDRALDAVRAVLRDVGIAETDETTEQYTDSVRVARGG